MECLIIGALEAQLKNVTLCTLQLYDGRYFNRSGPIESNDYFKILLGKYYSFDTTPHMLLKFSYIILIMTQSVGKWALHL
jgi:hypothetical protein